MFIWLGDCTLASLVGCGDCLRLDYRRLVLRFYRRLVLRLYHSVWRLYTRLAIRMWCLSALESEIERSICHGDAVIRVPCAWVYFRLAVRFYTRLAMWLCLRFFFKLYARIVMWLWRLMYHALGFVSSRPGRGR